MKTVKIILILLVTSLLILWVRGGEGSDIRRTLPLVNEKPALYQLGGLAMVGLLLMGLYRLNRSAQTDQSASSEFDDDDTFDDSDFDDH